MKINNFVNFEKYSWIENKNDEREKMRVPYH